MRHYNHHIVRTSHRDARQRQQHPPRQAVMIMDDPTNRVFLTEPMQSWITFLELQGARDIDPLTQAIGNFGAHNALDGAQPVTNFMTPLAAFGIIAATGDDAATFLHNQLTNDVEKLDAAHARLAGYCTPKGRLMATFLLWKSADAVLLQLPRQLQPAIQKRLQMFVMRSKVKLADRADDLVQIGLAGPAATTVLAAWFPALPDTPYAKVDAEAGTLIRLADTGDIGDPAAAGVARYVWITDPQTAQSAWPRLAEVLRPAGSAAWQLGEIRAAIPLVTAATQEQFVPQMINFEAVGGVNFQKGCYPGQEIVARSQYLGKLKRRMMPATVMASDVVPGTEVFSSADPEQACGMIVNAAAMTSGAVACLVEIKLAALESTVHLGAIDGPVLTFHPLPYGLADADRPDLR
jgi:folate-binding protein YgfZ